MIFLIPAQKIKTDFACNWKRKNHISRNAKNLKPKILIQGMTIRFLVQVRRESERRKIEKRSIDIHVVPDSRCDDKISNLEERKKKELTCT